MSETIFVARESFSTEVDGVPIAVHAQRTRVRDGHPLLRGREELFEPITVDYDIEQATNAPGEVRGQGSVTVNDIPSGSTGIVEEPKDYSSLKQPQLKELLDERGIDYPKGPVSNADLVKLLQASDSSS